MTTHDRYTPIIAWCRTRISQLREQPETPSREARLDELSAVVCMVQGLEVLRKLKERDSHETRAWEHNEPDYEGIAIEAIRGRSYGLLQ